MPSFLRKHHPSHPTPQKAILNEAPSPLLPLLNSPSVCPHLFYSHGRCSNSLQKPPNQSFTSRPFSFRASRVTPLRGKLNDNIPRHNLKLLATCGACTDQRSASGLCKLLWLHCPSRSPCAAVCPNYLESPRHQMPSHAHAFVNTVLSALSEIAFSLRSVTGYNPIHPP